MNSHDPTMSTEEAEARRRIYDQCIAATADGTAFEQADMLARHNFGAEARRIRHRAFMEEARRAEANGDRKTAMKAKTSALLHGQAVDHNGHPVN